MVKKLPFSCLKLGQKFAVIGRMSQGDVVGRVSAHYIALLIYTCFCAYTIQTCSTTKGKIRREIQNPQMFETDPESFSPAIYFS
jgi:hypothetical protein